MARIDWMKIGGGLLGDIARFPRFTAPGPAGGARAVLIGGSHADDVLGPEVLRAVYKEAKQGGLGLELVGWPVLPGSYGAVPRGGGHASGLSARIDAVVENSYPGADAVIHLVSPGDEMEAAPYALVPSRHRFPDDAAYERSVALAAALGTSYGIEDRDPHGLEAAAARTGVPVVRVVAGVRRSAGKEQRADLRQRLGWMLDAVAGGPGAPSPGALGRIDAVRASEAGFLHLRAQLDAPIDPDVAIAATWAFEPDQVEEFHLPAGRILELRRKGRVEVGDVIARSISPLR